MPGSILRRATTAIFAWWTIAFSIFAAPSPMSKDDDEDGDPSKRKFHLCFYSLEDRKETVLGDVNSYEITRDGKKMLVKINKDYAIIDLPKDKLETKDHELKLAGSRHAARSPRRVEPDLLRILAADARFLLRAEHERRRLEGDARQVRRAGAVRESSQRSHLPHRRADRRVEQRPRLRRRRRTAGNAAHQARLARRRAFARPRDQSLSHRSHPARRKLGQGNPLAAHRDRS